MTGAEFGQQFINALSLGSIYALVAIGLAMVFSHPAPDQLRPRRDVDDRRGRRSPALRKPDCPGRSGCCSRWAPRSCRVCWPSALPTGRCAAPPT